MLMLQAGGERLGYESIFWLTHLQYGRGDDLISSSPLGRLHPDITIHSLWPCRAHTQGMKFISQRARLGDIPFKAAVTV